MTSNYPRYALWVILGFALWLNYEAWIKDYAAVDAAAAAVAAARAPAGGLAGEIPQSGTGSAPGTVMGGAASSTADAAAATAPAAGGSLASAAGIGRRPGGACPHGCARPQYQSHRGTITQADLNVYTRIKGQTQPVRLENHDGPETLYLLQIALTGQRVRIGRTSWPPSLARLPIFRWRRARRRCMYRCAGATVTA